MLCNAGRPLEDIDGGQIIAGLRRDAVAGGFADAGFAYHRQRRVRVVHR